MNKSLLLLLLVLPLFTTLNAQNSYPPFEEIVRNFFTKYECEKANKINFIKKKEGYFIQEFNYYDDYLKNNPHNEILFWSSKTKTYNTLPFPKASKIDTESINHTLKSHRIKYTFDLQPYFGYENWAVDVVNLLESKENLTNDELYALARAYFKISSTIRSNISDSAKILDFGKNIVDSAKIAQYKSYHYKWIETLERLCAIEPDYETPIGSISTQHSNAYIDLYIRINTFQNEAEAKKELVDSLYSPFYLEYAKNMLNSCDSNSILFTYGDNDTYPLIYLQKKYNYRPDVLIIHRSMLFNNMYINHFRRPKEFVADSLKMVLSPKLYSNNQLNLIRISQLKNKDLSKALEYIKAVAYSTNKYYKYIPRELEIHLDSATTIDISLSSQSYLYKNELTILDIINSNIQERSIYFTQYPYFLDNTYKELGRSGFVYQLVDSSNSIKNRNIDDPKTFNQLIYNFKLGAINSELPEYLLPHLFMYHNSFDYLVEKYSTMGNKEKCMMVIKKYLETFPDSIFKTDLNFTFIIEGAYKVELHSEGDFMLKKLLDNWENKLNTEELSEKEIERMRDSANILSKVTKNQKLLKTIKGVLNQL